MGAAGRTPGDPEWFLTISKRVRDLVSRVCWVPKARFPFCFELASRTRFIPIFDWESRRLVVPKRDFRKEGVAKPTFHRNRV